MAVVHQKESEVDALDMHIMHVGEDCRDVRVQPYEIPQILIRISVFQCFFCQFCVAIQCLWWKMQQCFYNSPFSFTSELRLCLAETYLHFFFMSMAEDSPSQFCSAKTLLHSDEAARLPYIVCAYN